ncbi:MAG: radical SAM protein [bacterium]
MKSWDYIKHAPRLFVKYGMPLYLVHFITTRCNARCKHCLLGSEQLYNAGGKTTELSLEEIEKVSATMSDLLFLLPTGGEPFLRSDLPEIVKIYYKNNSVKNVVIPTNGWFTENIIKYTIEILNSCPDLDLGIDVSIDAIGKEHDKIRGVNGIFEKACQTYKELRNIEKIYDNFNVNIEITVSTFNQDKLPELYDYLKTYLKASSVFTLLVRGTPRDASAMGVDIDKYEQFNNMLDSEVKQYRLTGYYNFPLHDLINAKRIIRHKIITKTIMEKKYQIPCYAARLSVVLLSNGDVIPCELLDQKIGNVRDVNYDFRTIWHSERAKELRKQIRKTKCFCTYECFLTNNILFNPLMLPRIVNEWLLLKLSRSKRQLS